MLLVYLYYIYQLSPQFNERELAEFQEIFCVFDSRGADEISVSELGDIIRAAGENPTQSDIKMWVNKYEEHNRITFDMFLMVLEAIRSRRPPDTRDDIVEGLRHFDKEDTGFMRSADLHHLLTTIGEELTEAEAVALLDGHEDSNGNIDYENFVNTIISN